MNTYKKYLALITALEKKYFPQILRANKTVYDAFIADLKSSGIESARRNLQMVTASRDLTTLLQEMYKTAGVKGARLTYNELKASIKADQKATGFGRNERWIRAVIDYLRLNILEFAVAITETIKQDILNIITKAVDDGISIEAIVNHIQSSKIPRARARVIARTEIVRAANVGHAEGAKEFPFEVNKKWIAAKDHRTRDSHRLVHNHLVDELAFFTVPVYKNGKPTGQNDSMLYPGDPKASASNTINCRCRIIHEPKRDANGALIRRERTEATVIPLRPVQQLPVTGIAAIRKAIADNVFIGVKDNE